MTEGDLLAAGFLLIYRRGELTFDYRYSRVYHVYGWAGSPEELVNEDKSK